MKKTGIFLDKLKSTDTPVELEYSISDEELAEFLKTGILQIFEPHIFYTLKRSSQISVLSLEATCSYTIIDNHTLEPVSLDVTDKTDVTIDEVDDDNSDIQRGSDGRFDIRPTIFSLLYYMIPFDYSEVPLTRIETPDYTLMSETEYLKEKVDQNNPFASLSVEDIETE